MQPHRGLDTGPGGLVAHDWVLEIARFHGCEPSDEVAPLDVTPACDRGVPSPPRRAAAPAQVRPAGFLTRLLSWLRCLASR